MRQTSALGLEVNPVVQTRREWEDADDAFTQTIRAGALVAVPIATLKDVAT
jgi:hypothetical protein